MVSEKDFGRLFPELKELRLRVVGVNQTKKAIINGAAQKVFIAQNAEAKLVAELLDLCCKREISVCEVESKEALGAACGIKVGAAAAVLIRR
ncbi:MAG: ribosomal L7Ae/L30e/S12e/Gadd45 family protein [Candidatus Subteraquimicrobiales bacterium]|nr:ribosomal L7Ae/L30e/S12e/Gadd45 family protein [Candidatus Subteraquimicrobiales bacterium]